MQLSEKISSFADLISKKQLFRLSYFKNMNSFSNAGNWKSHSSAILNKLNYAGSG